MDTKRIYRESRGSNYTGYNRASSRRKRSVHVKKLFVGIFSLFMILGLSAFYGSGLVSAHVNVKDDDIRGQHLSQFGSMYAGGCLPYNLKKVRGLLQAFAQEGPFCPLIICNQNGNHVLAPFCQLTEVQYIKFTTSRSKMNYPVLP